MDGVCAARDWYCIDVRGATVPPRDPSATHRGHRGDYYSFSHWLACSDGGEMGELPHSLPHINVPSVPLSWQSFGIIAPYAVAMAIVGLVESLLTAQLVDEITETLQQDPRSVRLGAREYRGRHLWWHGRMRHDRSNHDWRAGFRRPHTLIYFGCALLCWFCSYF